MANTRRITAYVPFLGYDILDSCFLRGLLVKWQARYARIFLDWIRLYGLFRTDFMTYDEYKTLGYMNEQRPFLGSIMPLLDYDPGENGKYCNGGDLPRAFQNGDMIYFENYEWYENLEDGELKNKALNSKAIFEGSKGVDKESSDKAGNFCSTINEWEDFEHANHKGTDTNSSYNPYLDVSRIFNDHAGTNNTWNSLRETTNMQIREVRGS
ncbi:hypothetical protein Tco_0850883 [Tanacetum coccineum]